MHFKKLELVGFKSFLEKTTLHFEPGITAIVGPNGCGKSNIFDSIRWVLGEQSAKSLRGSDMQDVIFSGTDRKEPLGMAEVTLTFDNQNKFFNVDSTEVAITRRLFRSGESEYQLNKTPVRLKDILDLLLGTGIGAESYSIVAQGKIDLVLSSRPEDRRQVFDEAAGITKYKAQKRETMRKLEETEQNLLRVNDIITEVKRQIASLERQAAKARRYKEVFEELKSKEIDLSLMQKQELLLAKDGIISQLKALETKEITLMEMLRQQEEKIANHQAELKSLEDKMMGIKNQIMSLENQAVRNTGQINFDKEKIIELEANRTYLETQIGQVKNNLAQDEDKLSQVKKEHDGLRANIEEKARLLQEKESQINELSCRIKDSLESINKAKKDILELVNKIAHAKNEISDFTAKQQIFQARKKRLDIEKAKVFEEKAIAETTLSDIVGQLENIKKAAEELNLKAGQIKEELEKETKALGELDSQISQAERQKLGLESHKEFLDKLKSKYEDIGESLNAVIYLDKLPAEKVSGLVVKIKDYVNLNDEDKSYFTQAELKLSGEAKPIELDTQKIEEKLARLEETIGGLKTEREVRSGSIFGLNQASSELQQELHLQEIALANKEASHQTILEQYNKIKEEEDVIIMELQDVSREIDVLGKNIEVCQNSLSNLNSTHKQAEDLILAEENNVSINSKIREEVLVVITQTKTELEALNKRVVSDEATLSILEDTFRRDQENLANLERQMKESESKRESLEFEIRECEKKILEAGQELENQNLALKEAEANYQEASGGAGEVIKKIESDRRDLDGLKNQLHELQMQNKDIDFKYSSIKERMTQVYRVDLDAAEASGQVFNADELSQEIGRLKEKLDSYGAVNLIAIEEYDELKKRYDFLIQQQTDLDSAKQSLHEAILKINRTTKQMFLETFEKVREEFRNYFRMLFNGGDAQVYLIDEQDPLESGIEIICRPPGKKLQNVLLLSGGEKALSAIALIFAIFKVKPSPFCVLDEIDAALDEVNVDRFSRVLQEFSTTSQFIVVTHNKKTIANASVMYGITMQESGVSKIVSVKFSKDASQKAEMPTVESAKPA